MSSHRLLPIAQKRLLIEPIKRSVSPNPIGILATLFVALTLCSSLYAQAVTAEESDEAEEEITPLTQSTLVNLGFSIDFRYFAYAQHRADHEQRALLADLYIIDTHMNMIVESLHGNYGVGDPRDDDSDGALFSLMRDEFNRIERYAVDYNRKGRILFDYARAAAEEAARAEEEGAKTATVEEESDADAPDAQFSDFYSGVSYSITLTPAQQIDLQILLPTDVSQDYTITDDNLTGKLQNRIERVIIAPDNATLIVVISSIDRNYHLDYTVKTRYIH